MRIIKYVVFVLFLVLVLSACDPWKAEQIQAQAEADKVRVEAEQFALNQEAQRQHAEELHAMEMSNQRLEYERRIALEQTIRNGLSLFFQVVLLVGCAAVVYTILMGTRATVSAYQEATQGITKALVQAAEIRSRLIYLDDGRQFPAIVTQNMITDITTSEVTDLTKPKPANPQLATGAIANRHVGIVAKETRRSNSDTSVNVPLSQQPPIIEARFKDVKEYMELLAAREKWERDDA